jgi:hypothetical protein
MTTTVKVHVNGNYRATCHTTIDGEKQEEVIVNNGEEKMLPHHHGKTCTYEITEEQVASE